MLCTEDKSVVRSYVSCHMQRGKSQTLSNVLAHLLMFYLHAEKKKHPYIHCTVKEENEKKNPNIMMIAYEKCIKL